MVLPWFPWLFEKHGHRDAVGIRTHLYLAIGLTSIYEVPLQWSPDAVQCF